MASIIDLRRHGEELRLRIRVRPGAGRTCVKEVRDGILRMDVAVPPEKGKANVNLRKYLAKLLRIPGSGITVCSGERSRDKVVGISGIDAGEIEAAIDNVLGGRT